MSEQSKDSSLTDFLLARIADDESAARAAEKDFAWQREQDFGGFTVLVHDFITSYDPGRVLAECEAKRRIVEMYFGPTEDDEGNLSAIGGYGEAWLDAIHFLALPYADHPDYREEWRA